MKLLSIIFLLFVFFSCDTPKKAEQKEAEIVEQEEAEIVEQEEPEYIEISMATLVNDVINSGLFYEDKHIKIRARVKRTGRIETGRPNVHFYSYSIPIEYEIGETYTFKFHIYEINYSPISERRTNWHIHAKYKE